MRLGRRQLDLLAGLGGVHTALIVPDAISRSLTRRGLLVSVAERRTDDGFLSITAEGYRAIADALDAGTIVREPFPPKAK
jgi:hypothetical protein